MKIKTNKRIQAQVDKKNGSDLRDIADYFVNDAYGICYLYFVGTVESILQRLAKLQNTNV